MAETISTEIQPIAPYHSALRMLPDFIIVGAQKAGTTSLYHLLCEHPCIKPARRKELNFYTIRYRKGVRCYRKQFPSRISKLWAKILEGKNLITGEASPHYMFHPHAPKRIAATLPDVKLIVLLRNPVDRAYSHYHHMVRNKIETLSFEEALAKEEERMAGEIEKMLQDEHYMSFNQRSYSYLSRGIYVSQLQKFSELFKREQMLILKSEDFFEKPREALEQAFSFLGLEKWQPPKIKPLNAGRYSEIKSGTRKFLENYFEPHNRRLYEFLGRDFGWANEYC